jgi:hypothetical protein
VKSYIIVHHSATTDGRTNNWLDICRYHQSWRRVDLGEIITAEKAGELTAQGIRCEPPWKPPCGYHRGIERENGVLVVRQGRPLDQDGAHCEGFNHSGVGLCVVGNFDQHEPDLYLWDEIKRQIKVIATELGTDAKTMADEGMILGHRETYELLGKRQIKTCPGSRFDMDKLRQELSDNI